jgi:hypothetical protein
LAEPKRSSPPRIGLGRRHDGIDRRLERGTAAGSALLLTVTLVDVDVTHLLMRSWSGTRTQAPT